MRWTPSSFTAGIRPAIKHLSDGELGLQITDRMAVRATITYDEEDREVPLLIVDGREITWREFGHMLKTYEGWQFKLEIKDTSEEF